MESSIFPENIEGLLIDFDGVISKTSIDHTINFIHQFINQYTPISRDFIHDYIKVISSFSIENSVQLFFTSFGLESKIENFFREYKAYDANGKNISIEKDFYAFLDFCNQSCLPYWIFSLANPERIIHGGGIDAAKIYSLENQSKSDIRTYHALSRNKGIELKHWLYLDDNPMALRTGKIAGLNTVMMMNNFYNKRDFEYFKDYVDLKIENFSELKNILSS